MSTPALLLAGVEYIVSGLVYLLSGVDDVVSGLVYLVSGLEYIVSGLVYLVSDVEDVYAGLVVSREEEVGLDGVHLEALGAHALKHVKFLQKEEYFLQKLAKNVLLFFRFLQGSLKLPRSPSFF